MPKSWDSLSQQVDAFYKRNAEVLNGSRPLQRFMRHMTLGPPRPAVDPQSATPPLVPIVKDEPE